MAYIPLLAVISETISDRAPSKDSLRLFSFPDQSQQLQMNLEDNGMNGLMG